MKKHNPFSIGNIVYYQKIKSTIIGELQFDGFIKIRLDRPLNGETILEVWIDNLELKEDADTTDFIEQRKV